MTLEEALNLPAGTEFYVSNPCPRCGQAKLMVRVVPKGDRWPRTWPQDTRRQTISIWRGLRVICAGCALVFDTKMKIGRAHV